MLWERHKEQEINRDNKIRNHRNYRFLTPVFEVSHLISASLELFNMLQVTVPTFNNNSDTINHTPCTGPKLFQQQEPHSDRVFVRYRKARKTKS